MNDAVNSVFVLTIQWPDRGGSWENVHGIYTSAEKAKNAIKNLEQSGRTINSYDIDEWTLNE